MDKIYHTSDIPPNDYDMTSWIQGQWIRRYKRFFVDIWVPAWQKEVTAHCVNTGPMMGLGWEQQETWMSRSDNPKRKLPYTLEALKDDTTYIGVNTLSPNRLIAHHWHELPLSHADDVLTREVKVLDSRLDFYVTSSQRSLYIEVKNVHLKKDTWALFPDTVTTRGAKHLKTLMALKAKGHKVAMIYVVQRPDCQHFDVARTLDPVYAKLWDEARSQGIDCWVFGCQVTPTQALVHLNATPLVVKKRME